MRRVLAMSLLTAAVIVVAPLSAAGPVMAHAASAQSPASSASSQAEAAFPLVRASATEVVFENLQHDFPQRIIYTRAGATLRARVESADGKKAQDFPMTAVACPG